MVTGPQAWTDEPYLKPFDAMVRDLRQRGAGRFVLQAPPSSRVLFRSGPYTVVRIGDGA
jgi:hypothetical protein